MKLMVGRAMAMLVRGMDRDPQAATAGVLILGYGASLGGVVLMRWGEANEATGLIRLGDEYLPLTAPVAEVLADYADRVPGVGGGRMFADAAGCSVRVRELVARIDELTGGWFPADVLRSWARAACPELMPGEIRHCVEKFARMGAKPEQCQRFKTELERRRREAVMQWHGCLGWCAAEATKPAGGDHGDR